MSKRTRGKHIADQFKTLGITKTPDTTQVLVLEEDVNGDVLRASGTTVPTDGETGYSKGAIFLDTNVGAGTTGFYENVGTTTACNFDTIGAGGGGITAISGASDTDISTPASGEILVWDGVDSWDNVPMSGDATIDATGAFTISEGAVEDSMIEGLADGEFIIGVDGTAANNAKVTMSGDGALANDGTLTVSDLTIASEAQGDILYFNGSNWVRLAAGTNGQFLKTQGAAANPMWDNAVVGSASILSSPFTVEGGTYDPATTVTTQTTSAAALTIPDLGGTAQEWVFSKVAQTLENKTLTSAVLNTGVSGTAVLDEDNMASDSNTQLATQQSIKAYVDTQVATQIANVVEDTTPQLGGDLDLNGNSLDFPTTANISDCLDEDDMSSDSATMLATQQSIKAYVDSGTTTMTNKSIDADTNTLTNVNGDELDSIAATAGTYGIPMILPVPNAGAATVSIFNANAPFKFRVLDAWAIDTQAGNAGNWKLDNGSNDITSTVAYAASDTGLSRADSVDDAYHDVAASGSLRLINSNAADTSIVYVSILRVD